MKHAWTLSLTIHVLANALLCESSSTSPTFSPTATVPPTGSYEHMGTGHCEAGYYAGWNSADATLEACKARCTEEAQCLFFSLNEAQTCSRYNSGAGDCSSVVGANDYELYRKLTAAPTTSAPTTASPTGSPTKAPSSKSPTTTAPTTPPSSSISPTTVLPTAAPTIPPRHAHSTPQHPQQYLSTSSANDYPPRPPQPPPPQHLPAVSLPPPFFQQQRQRHLPQAPPQPPPPQHPQQYLSTTVLPTAAPTTSPTSAPTSPPTTTAPTTTPTASPTAPPTSAFPTAPPTTVPPTATRYPSTNIPTATHTPTASPTAFPTGSPSTLSPSKTPTTATPTYSFHPTAPPTSSFPTVPGYWDSKLFGYNLLSPAWLLDPTTDYAQNFPETPDTSASYYASFDAATCMVHDPCMTIYGNVFTSSGMEGARVSRGFTPPFSVEVTFERRHLSDWFQIRLVNQQDNELFFMGFTQDNQIIKPGMSVTGSSLSKLGTWTFSFMVYPQHVRHRTYHATNSEYINEWLKRDYEFGDSSTLYVHLGGKDNDQSGLLYSSLTIIENIAPYSAVPTHLFTYCIPNVPSDHLCTYCIPDFVSSHIFTKCTPDLLSNYIISNCVTQHLPHNDRTYHCSHHISCDKQADNSKSDCIPFHVAYSGSTSISTLLHQAPTTHSVYHAGQFQQWKLIDNILTVLAITSCQLAAAVSPLSTLRNACNLLNCTTAPSGTFHG
ncbi:hypothetical protein CYMTET_31577 [Cymbomonas tetramitiformis]|uniref:Apple domain-containing protein n=1 Tax=Cymbomonas tetramitiformis TaxID=36881 RepID=A0AAE0KSR5_9CHLO|nr:hypothetical protein CYMTET_31577 [Cymbomonas tetramitiformis]